MIQRLIEEISYLINHRDINRSILFRTWNEEEATGVPFEQRKSKWVALFFAAVLSWVCAFALFDCIRHIRYVETEATVDNVSGNCLFSGESHLQYHFNADGYRYRGSDNFKGCSQNHSRTGSFSGPVPVIYNPRDPADNLIGNAYSLGNLIGYCLATVMMIGVFLGVLAMAFPNPRRAGTTFTGNESAE